MKIILINLFASFLAMASTHAQDTICLGEYRVGLAGRIFPKKEFLFIEFEADKRIKVLYSLGVKVGHIRTTQSFTGSKFLRTYISGGITFHILGNRNFFIDPSAHIMYLKIIRTTDGGFFDGGGIMGSLRLGYNFGSFGLGIKGLTTFNIGATKLPSLNGKIFDFYFDEFQYGFHLSYKI